MKCKPVREQSAGGDFVQFDFPELMPGKEALWVSIVIPRIYLILSDYFILSSFYSYRIATIFGIASYRLWRNEAQNKSNQIYFSILIFYCHRSLKIFQLLTFLFHFRPIPPAEHRAGVQNKFS